MISDEFHIFIVQQFQSREKSLFMSQTVNYMRQLLTRRIIPLFFFCFFFRACTICIYKEVKLLGYCVIPKRREVLRTLENCRREWEHESFLHIYPCSLTCNAQQLIMTLARSLTITLLCWHSWIYSVWLSTLPTLLQTTIGNKQQYILQSGV